MPQIQVRPLYVTDSHVRRKISPTEVVSSFCTSIAPKYACFRHNLTLHMQAELVQLHYFKRQLISSFVNKSTTF